MWRGIPWWLECVDGGDAGGGGTVTTTTTANPQTTTNQPAAPAEPSLTQADVDRIVQERLKRDRRERAPEIADLQAKAAELDEIKASQQSAEERTAAELAEARASAAAAQATVELYRAASAHGITGDDVDLLSDATPVDDRASRLGALLAAERELAALRQQQTQQPVPPPAGRPVPSMRPGSVPVETTEKPSAVDAARAAAIRRGRATPQ